MKFPVLESLPYICGFPSWLIVLLPGCPYTDSWHTCGSNRLGTCPFIPNIVRVLPCRWLVSLFFSVLLNSVRAMLLLWMLQSLVNAGANMCLSCVVVALVNAGIKQIDFDNDFVQSILPKGEEVYAGLPPLVTGNHNKGMALKLNKALYGMKSAPCHWWRTVKTGLEHLGFESSQHYQCLFTHKEM